MRAVSDDLDLRAATSSPDHLGGVVGRVLKQAFEEDLGRPVRSKGVGLPGHPKFHIGPVGPLGTSGNRSRSPGLSRGSPLGAAGPSSHSTREPRRVTSRGTAPPPLNRSNPGFFYNHNEQSSSCDDDETIVQTEDFDGGLEQRAPLPPPFGMMSELHKDSGLWVGGAGAIVEQPKTSPNGRACRANPPSSGESPNFPGEAAVDLGPHAAEVLPLKTTDDSPSGPGRLKIRASARDNGPNEVEREQEQWDTTHERGEAPGNASKPPGETSSAHPRPTSEDAVAAAGPGSLGASSSNSRGGQMLAEVHAPSRERTPACHEDYYTDPISLHGSSLSASVETVSPVKSARLDTLKGKIETQSRRLTEALKKVKGIRSKKKTKTAASSASQQAGGSLQGSSLPPSQLVE